MIMKYLQSKNAIIINQTTLCIKPHIKTKTSTAIDLKQDKD